MATQSRNQVRLEIPAEHIHLSMLSDCIRALLQRVPDLPDRDTAIYNIQLAAHECCANVVDHAYAGAGGIIMAVLEWQDTPRQFVIELHDSGQAFNPADSPAPNLEEAQIHGYGLFLIHELMDEVGYDPQPGDNCWRLVKKFTVHSSQSQ
jgi:serine/threonine-protein kinase RsbW